jgi:hypothetical protein
VGRSLAQCPGVWPADTDQAVEVAAIGSSHEITPDSSGGFYTAYLAGIGGSTGQVRVARVDSTGSLTWDIAVLAGANGVGWKVAISVDGNGGCFVAWLRGATTSTRVAHIASGGSVTWTSTAINGSGIFAGTLDLSWDGMNGAWIASSLNNSGSSSFFLNRVDGAGNLTFGSTGLLLGVYSASSGFAPRIAIDAFQDPTLGSAVVGAFEPLSDGGIIRAFKASASGVAWNIDVTLQTTDNSSPAVVHDNAGGAIVSWVHVETPFALASTRAQHVLASGLETWDSNQALLSFLVSPLNASALLLVSNGEGGAILGQIADGYVQALRLDDTSIPGGPLIVWEATMGASDPRDLAMSPDGEGGAYFAWTDPRGEGVDVYSRRFSADGVSLWFFGDAPVATGPGAQAAPKIALIASAATLADATAGEPKHAVAVAWSDSRTSVEGGVAARRVDYFGATGCAAPLVTSLGDVAGDQGGFVELKWDRSYLDDLPADEIVYYSVWRRLPADQKRTAADLIDLGRAGRQDLETLVHKAYRVTSAPGASGAPPGFWELVAVVEAHRNPEGYTYSAKTRMDSSDVASESAADHLFFVSAHGRACAQRPWWDSNVVTGRSIDNLAPIAPAAFAAKEEVGLNKANGQPGMVLTWAPNTEPDLRDYAVYKGSTPDFVPARPSEFVARVSATRFEDMDVAPGESVYYRVAAFDEHGNSSPYTDTAGGRVSTGVGSRDEPGFDLAKNFPNPVTASTQIRWSLPVDGPASLQIFDLSGRQVRTLFRGMQSKGSHITVWDGTDSRGNRLAAGVYAYRLEAGRSVRSMKMLVLR